MKKLLVVAAAALVGAAALAQTPGGGWPRVYQYAASLNTAVAKNAKTVTYAGCERAMDVDVCYRVKGTVSIKGVIVFGCACVDEEEYDSLPDGYPIILMATSSDNYRGVTFAEGDVWTANRLGSPLSSKAKVAELGFDTQFRAGPTNEGACVRDYELRHAGFGTAGMVESGEGYDITAISGAVIGSALAPYCSADQNTCPRCVDNGECTIAIAFEPCTVDDCAPYDGENTETGVAYGSFTVKYNKTLASAIKNIPTEEIQETIDVLVPKVFGKNAIAPSFANYNDYFNLPCSYSIALYDTFGDGWNGGTLDVLVNGVVVLDNITLSSGAGPVYYDFPVTQGDMITTLFTAGSWAGEPYYSIHISEGNQVWYAPPASLGPPNITAGQLYANCCD